MKMLSNNDAAGVALCLNMSSDTDTVCVDTALALYLKEKKNRHWTKERYKRRPQYTNKRKFYDTLKTE
jgi:hypothetical protein